MVKIYLTRNTSNHVGSAGTTNVDFEITTVATATITTPGANPGPETVYFYTPTSEPNLATWPNGSYTWFLDVSTANSALELTSVTLHRYNSDFSSQLASKSATYNTALSSVQTYSNTITWDDGTQNPGGSAQTDRFVVSFAFTRVGGHGSQSVVIDVGGSADTRIETPLDGPPTEVTSCELVTFQKSTNTSTPVNQDISLSRTPKAVMVFSAAADNNFINVNACQTLGFSDGTNHACTTVIARDNLADSVTLSAHHDDAVYVSYLHNFTSGSPSLLASATCSFIENGIRFTWNTNNTDDEFIHVFALYDVDDVEVGTTTIGTTDVGTRAYNLADSGLLGDAVLFMGSGMQDGNKPVFHPNFGCTFMFGAAMSSTKRWTESFNSENGQIEADNVRIHSNSHCMVSLDDDSFASDFRADFDSFSTGQFTLDIEQSNVIDRMFSYMVIKSSQIDIGAAQSPTLPGTQAITTTAAVGDVAGVFLCNTNSINLWTSGSFWALNSLGAGHGTATDESAASLFVDIDAADPTDSARASNTGFIIGGINTSGQFQSGTLSELATEEFTINWTVVPASARHYGWIAFGKPTVQLFERFVSDNIISNDTLQRLASFVRTPQDSITVTETADRTRIAPRTAEDTTNLSESTARTYSALRAPTDTISLSDSVERILEALRQVSDTINLSEAVDAGKLLIRTVEDTIVTSETVQRILTAVRNPQDTVATSETVQRILSAIRTASDTVGLNETVNRIFIAVKNTQDTVATSETVQRFATFLRNPTDTITTLDTVQMIFIALRNAADTTNLSENVQATKILGGAILRQVQDTIETSDTVQRILSAVRNPSDSVSLSDTIDAGKVSIREVFDTIVTSDTVQRLATFQRLASDSVTSLDTVQRLFTALRTALDSITSSEDVDASKVGGLFTRNVSDTITTSDTVLRLASFVRNISDTIGLSEVVQGFIPGLQPPEPTQPSTLHTTERKVKGSEREIKGSDRFIKGFRRQVKGSEQQIEGFRRQVKGSERDVKGSEQQVKGSERQVKGSQRQVKGSRRRIKGAAKRFFVK